MDINSSKIQQLIEYPSESLNVELKRWISPDTDEGRAKIVKAAIALRNFNGGHLIIGFDGKTLTPDINNVPTNVRTEFHIDKIQGLISRYSSELFEVFVEFPERGGQEYPVIIIDAGVKTPVAAKQNLPGDGSLIKTDDVYIRSLSANGTPSTTKAKWKDWGKIVEICFDNREADIGRFLRRHLGGATPDMIQGLLPLLSIQSETAPVIEDQLRSYLDEGKERLHQIVTERQVELPQHGSWEVAFFIIGEIPEHSTDRNFLNLLSYHNPRYSGWPVWVDSRSFPDHAQPYVTNGHWEAFIYNFDREWNVGLDFLRLSPQGKFYLYRVLEDDVAGESRGPAPFTTLDFVFPILRVAEAMAVGISFAKAMECDPENTKLSFAFRWSGLTGRVLSTWAHPVRGLLNSQSAYQDEVIAFQDIPLNTPLPALESHVYQVTKPLFEVFGGFSFAQQVIEDLTRNFFERNL